MLLIVAQLTSVGFEIKLSIEAQSADCLTPQNEHSGPFFAVFLSDVFLSLFDRRR